MKRLWLLLLVILWVGGASMVQAGINTWTSTGPEGGVVQALAIDPLTPTTLYVATGGFGVFKSTNGGNSWTPANTGLPTSGLLTLAIDPLTPTTLYVGTDLFGPGVSKSTDGGTSWSAANTGLSGSDIFALVIDPTTPTTLYAGTGGSLTTACLRARTAGPPGRPPTPACRSLP